jgi:multidrug efflux pump subunit AcrB
MVGPKRASAGVTGILSYFTRHRTAANLLLVVMVMLGLAAAPRMRAQFFPDIVIDTVSVSVQWQGAGPEEIDGAIVQTIEPALLAVEGVETTNSTSQEGSARIVVDFEPGWDMARAADDVKTAVDAVAQLPADAEDPVVRRGAWRDRVTDVVITGPVSKDQLALFADEFVTRLFQVGVTRSTIRGVASPETVIEISQSTLIANDISLRDIANAIAEEVDADPAGDVGGGATRIRTGVAKRSADQIADIVVRTNADGSNIRVGDLAVVRNEGVDRDRAYFVGDDPAISIRIDRSEKGDAIGIQAAVQDIADRMVLSLPKGVKIELIRTRAKAISDRLNILLNNGLLGLGLVLGLLFLFLNARTAFWVAMGIPAAMTATIALMFAFGLTINMISLFALIITLGIVVDDAIVVGEHADFRARQLGESPVEAAENAAIRMAPPVFSATVTTIIAFSALVAISGRFGSLIADIPFTVIVVLTASLIECFLILPNHMSHALAAIERRRWYDAPSHYFNIGFSWFRERAFRPFMRFVIVFKYPVFALTVLVLASQAALFLRGDVQWRFFNAPERGSISGNFAMLPNASRDDTLAMMRALQKATEETAKKFADENDGVNPLDFVMAEVGGTTGRGLAGSSTKDKDQLGSIAIELIEADLRDYSSFDFLGELQDNVVRHPSLETLSFRGWRSGPGGNAIDVQLFGADADVLKRASEAIKTSLAKYPEVSAVEDNLAFDKEELILELTPQGQALGFTIDGLGAVLRNRLNGVTAAKYPVGARTAEINVRLPKNELRADYLERAMLRTTQGNYVPMADIISVQSRTGFATVRREDGLRVVSVSGDISEDDPERANLITAELRDVILPRIQQDFGIQTRMAGLAEQENTFLSDALLGFGLCLLGIYLTLAWIFSSWTRPAVVMAVIPFGLVGTIYGHYVWEVPLSMFTIVGLIGMTGIIINDSIVLVTTVDEYATDRGMKQAIIDGACDRLRPVLLTTLTTVLGLMPLLMEQSQQAQFLKPTVITLCYGLGFGLLLVLLVVPSLMAMQLDVARQISALRRVVGLHHRAWGLRLVMLGAGGATAAAFGATVGYTAVTRNTLPPLLSVYESYGITASPWVGFGFFIAVTALIGLLAWALVTISFVRSRRHGEA